MRTRNRWVSLAVGAGVALAAAVVPVVSSTTASAADQKRDGRAESRALASCWEVKQVDPSAPDGRYWLYTPALQYPQQFWCDMTTDGGGWVLIGRGRQGWDFTAEGQGTTAGVSATTAVASVSATMARRITATAPGVRSTRSASGRCKSP